MNDGKQLKYGQISGGEGSGMYGILVAGMVVNNASGKFVYRTGASTDTVTLALDGTTEILGFLECEAIASAVGTEKRKIIDDLTAVFRIPINGGTTFYHYHIGKKCDISVATGNIQGANIAEGVEGTLIIVDGDTVNSEWVDVKINPVKIGATACS